MAQQHFSSFVAVALLVAISIALYSVPVKVHLTSLSFFYICEVKLVIGSWKDFSLSLFGFHSHIRFPCNHREFVNLGLALSHLSFEIECVLVIVFFIEMWISL